MSSTTVEQVRAPAPPIRPRVQASLRVGAVDDPLEREADVIAERVLRMPDPGPAVIQRCPGGCPPDGCGDDEQVLQRRPQSHSSGYGQGRHATAHGIQAARGGGRRLPADSRSFFERRLGSDVSHVRVHADDRAAQLARSVAAKAFTVGSDVFFGAGQYQPATEAGRRLLAHELAHVMQQRPGQQRPAILRSCGRAVSPDEPCTPQAGDISDVGSSSDDIYLFVVECDDMSPGEATRLADHVRGLHFDPGDELHIHGFASEEGDADFNEALSCARALRAREIVRSSLPAGQQPVIHVFQHGATPGERTSRRSIVLDRPGPQVSTAPTPTPAACPPTSGAAATTLSEYIDLIRCAESVTGFTPTTMLAMLRQMYYGKSWSATSTTSRWDDVIPCSVNVGHPRPILGSTLFDALHASATVQGVDVGHIFTGLESMRCPRSQVVLSSLLPAGTVSMDNEAFSTWGGDLGAAAAAMVACWDMSSSERLRSEDCGRRDPPGGLAFYLTQIQAPLEDLEGDIAAFVMRAAELGIPCRGSLRQPLNLSGAVSDLFAGYFQNTGPAGRTKADRFRCFAEAVGATISGTTITNKSQLVQRFQPPVESFAAAYYIKIMKDVRGALPAHRIVPHGHSVIRLGQHSASVVSLFFDFVEHHL